MPYNGELVLILQWIFLKFDRLQYLLWKILQWILIKLRMSSNFVQQKRKWSCSRFTIAILLHMYQTCMQIFVENNNLSMLPSSDIVSVYFPRDTRGRRRNQENVNRSVTCVFAAPILFGFIYNKIKDATDFNLCISVLSGVNASSTGRIQAESILI